MPAWCGVAGEAIGELVNCPPNTGLMMSGGRLEGCDDEDAPATGVTVEAVDAESVLFDGIGTGGLCDTVSAHESMIRATDVTADV